MNYKEFIRATNIVTVLGKTSERPLVEYLMNIKENGNYHEISFDETTQEYYFEYVVGDDVIFEFEYHPLYGVSNSLYSTINFEDVNKDFLEIFDKKYKDVYKKPTNFLDYKDDRYTFLQEYIGEYLGLESFKTE